MSELSKHHHEKHERVPSHEHVQAPERHEHVEQSEKREHEKLPDQYELEHRVKHEAKSRHETQIIEAEKAPQQPILGLHRELKLQAYAQTLRKVRRHLTPLERKFSKIIHQPTVEALSETSSQTIARPSGILGGGIAALIGSSIVLYMSKHYGFRYSFFVYILFFITGFAAGIILEFLIKSVRSKS